MRIDNKIISREVEGVLRIEAGEDIYLQVQKNHYFYDEEISMYLPQELKNYIISFNADEIAILIEADIEVFNSCSFDKHVLPGEAIRHLYLHVVDWIYDANLLSTELFEALSNIIHDFKNEYFPNTHDNHMDPMNYLNEISYDEII